jgi:hypothetical protein
MRESGRVVMRECRKVALLGNYLVASMAALRVDTTVEMKVVWRAEKKVVTREH